MGGSRPGFESVKFNATIKNLRVTSNGDGEFSVSVPYQDVENMLQLRHGQMLVLQFVVSRRPRGDHAAH